MRVINRTELPIAIEGGGVDFRMDPDGTATASHGCVCRPAPTASRSCRGRWLDGADGLRRKLPRVANRVIKQ